MSSAEDVKARLQERYVAGVRAAREAAERRGVLQRLESSPSPAARHVRTLFAIHNVDDLVDMDLAWWSYPAMRAVDAFLAGRRHARVFEYGAGASTVWLSKRAASVTSVEHDTEYVGYVEKLVAGLSNVTLHAVPGTPATPESTVRSQRHGHEHLDFADYVNTIDKAGGEFDLIVVDGRARVDAFKAALEHLSADGVVVFDNLRRKRYWEPVAAMSGLRVELYRGATPALPYPTTTGLIWRA